MRYYTMREYLIRQTISRAITRACLNIIAFCNKSKDDTLARMLHEKGGLYQTRPQDGWQAPMDWECWKDC